MVIWFVEQFNYLITMSTLQTDYHHTRLSVSTHAHSLIREVTRAMQFFFCWSISLSSPLNPSPPSIPLPPLPMNWTELIPIQMTLLVLKGAPINTLTPFMRVIKQPLRVSGGDPVRGEAAQGDWWVGRGEQLVWGALLVLAVWREAGRVGWLLSVDRLIC